MMIEAPLERTRDFVIYNYMMLLDNGKLIYIRKMFETDGGKKLKPLYIQRFLIKEISHHDSVMPQFVPIGKDFLAHRRAHLQDKLDHYLL